MSHIGIFVIFVSSFWLVLQLATNKRQPLGAFWTVAGVALAVSFGLVVWAPRTDVVESHFSWINLWVIGFLLSMFCIAALCIPRRSNFQSKPDEHEKDSLSVKNRGGARPTVVGTIVALLALITIISGWVWYLRLM